MMMASTHWKVERVVAVAMVGIMPTALFVQGAFIDHLFTTFVYLHGHWSVHWVQQIIDLPMTLSCAVVAL